MQLLAVIAENFQGIVERTRIDLGALNVLIGKNDVGKSTVLKALDLFLNGTTPTPEHTNIGTDSLQITIELILDAKVASIVIDEDISTTFETEELVNEDGYVQIKRVWDTSKSRATIETFMLRKKFDDDDFLPLTENQLIALCTKNGIVTQKANSAEYNNAEKRSKLRRHFTGQQASFSYVYEKMPSSGTSRMRNIASALSKALPRFEFFRADTSLSETDTAIQNYFRQLAVDALNEFGISEAEKSVTAKLASALEGITTKINDAIPQSDAVRPSTSFDWSKVVKTTFATGNETIGVPLHLRGDGFRRITMMAYFEYLAEQTQDNERDVIFGFEEPETFLHPSAQEQLFAKLSALAENNYQVIISSHSPIIIANTRKIDLIHVSKSGNTTTVNCCVEDIAQVANDLGITVDNQFVHLFDTAKVLFLVEGPDDVLALNHVASLYKINGEVANTFEDLGIILIPIGGCGSIKHWVALNLLSQLSKPYFILLDSDAEASEASSPNRQTLLDFGFIEGDHFLVTRKRMIENYIPCGALNRIVPNANLNYGDWDHVKNICKKHPLAGYLGGGNVTERHFTKLTFDDLKTSFHSDSLGDEFLEIFNNVSKKIPTN